MNSIAVSISIAARQYQLSLGKWPACVLLGPDQYKQLSKELSDMASGNLKEMIGESGLHSIQLWEMEIFEIKDTQDMSITLGGEIQRWPL